MLTICQRSVNIFAMGVFSAFSEITKTRGDLPNIGHKLKRWDSHMHQLEILRPGCRTDQRRRHEFFTGEGSESDTQTHLPPKFSFSSNLGHFVLKMLENAKNVHFLRKNILKCPNFWGVDHRCFQKWGSRPPPPPPVGDTPGTDDPINCWMHLEMAVT